MSDELIYRLSRNTLFSYGQIKAYVERVRDAEDIMAYNILEAAAMNIDLDILGW